MNAVDICVEFNKLTSMLFDNIYVIKFLQLKFFASKCSRPQDLLKHCEYDTEGFTFHARKARLHSIINVI